MSKRDSDRVSWTLTGSLCTRCWQCSPGRAFQWARGESRGSRARDQAKVFSKQEGTERQHRHGPGESSSHTGAWPEEDLAEAAAIFLILPLPPSEACTWNTMELEPIALSAVDSCWLGSVTRRLAPSSLTLSSKNLFSSIKELS